MAIQPNSSYNRRKHIIQQTAFGRFRLLSYGVATLLFFILGFIIVKGIGVINWEFLSQAPSDGMTKGGIWPAIFGTCLPDGRKCSFRFPDRRDERHLHERICKGWKTGTLHPDDDEQPVRHPVHRIRDCSEWLSLSTGWISETVFWQAPSHWGCWPSPS